jgi:hypothetical protein
MQPFQSKRLYLAALAELRCSVVATTCVSDTRKRSLAALAKLRCTVGSGCHGVHERHAEASSLERVHARDRGATRGRDLVFELSGVLACFVLCRYITRVRLSLRDGVRLCTCRVRGSI